jgi:hypothetical protein
MVSINSESSSEAYPALKLDMAFEVPVEEFEERVAFLCKGICLLRWQPRLDVRQLFLQLPHLFLQALEAGRRGRRGH